MTRIHAVMGLARGKASRPRCVLTLEAEVGEEGDIFGPLSTLGQLGEDQEAFPAPLFPKGQRLESHSQVVQVALGDIAPPHDAPSANVLED